MTGDVLFGYPYSEHQGLLVIVGDTLSKEGLLVVG